MESLPDFAAPLLAWYEKNARPLPWRQNITPYRVWISEIMLQQTRVEAVIPYYHRFLATLPDVAQLATVAEDTLLKLWEGLGYYSRARNLQKTAVLLMQKYQGIFPQTYEELLQLPGIGPYTAGAIASIAFQQPVPAVDGNVLRVLARLLCYEKDIMTPRARQELTTALTARLDVARPGDFNQAMMELGATVCLPNGSPRCPECPLEGFCLANAQGSTLQYPVRRAKQNRRVEKRTVFILLAEEQVLLVKRPSKGLLAGMWEFPCVDGNLDVAMAREYLKTVGIPATTLHRLPTAAHVFTHLQWQLQGYQVSLPQIVPVTWSSAKWVRQEELATSYAIPSAYKAYLPYARNARENLTK